MLALRALTGPKLGQIIPLQMGTSVLGRGGECDIQIPDRGISKQHARFQVTEDKVIVTDLNSTNGTFVNGVKIQYHRLHVGDKIMFHTVIFDLVPQSAMVGQQFIAPSAPPQWHGNAAIQSEMFSEPGQVPLSVATNDNEPAKISVQSLADLWQFLQTYVNTVALPGIYKLAEVVEFKFVIGGLLAGFVIAVTVLSSIPMIQITRSSVQNESRRRALTLARYLEARNREAVGQNLDTALDVNMPREEGIKETLIIDAKDGHILAPASRAGRYDDSTFIQTARSKDTEYTEQIDSSTIGASVPIKYFNADQGVQSVLAYAVVIYDMGSLAVDDGRVISLFMETFIIALIVGLSLYFVLIKLMEQPLVELHQQLDTALREQRSDLKTNFRFPVLVSLYSNINSALGRAGQSSESGVGAPAPQILSHHIAGLLELTEHAALAIHGETESIVGVTPRFEELTGISSASLVNQSLSAITDQALRLNLQALLGKSRQESNVPASDQLEFGGQNFVVTCQAVPLGNTISFYLVLIKPSDGESV